MLRTLTLLSSAMLLVGCARVNVRVPEIPQFGGGGDDDDARVVTADVYRVQQVLGPRSFEVLYDRDPTVVLIHGIEVTHRKEAAETLKDLIDGETVRLYFPLERKRDSLGRLVCDVYLGDLNVAEALIRMGYARAT
jgi:hypothetical protein